MVKCAMVFQHLGSIASEQMSGVLETAAAEATALRGGLLSPHPFSPAAAARVPGLHCLIDLPAPL